MMNIPRQPRFLPWLLALFVLLAPQATAVAVAEEQAAETAAQSPERAAAGSEERDREAEQLRSSIVQEAVTTVRQTENALRALDEDRPQAALEALETAIGKLEILLAREPELAYAPLRVTWRTHDLLATVEDVRALRKEVEQALKADEVQRARRLMTGLASEIVVEVSELPLAVWPSAIRAAVAHIEAEELDQAKTELQVALATVVVREHVIPLPLLLAESAIDEARPLARKSAEERTDPEQLRLESLLEDAAAELEFAEALGYGSPATLDDLRKRIAELRDQAGEGEAIGAGIFERIKKLFGDAGRADREQRQTER